MLISHNFLYPSSSISHPSRIEPAWATAAPNAAQQPTQTQIQGGNQQQYGTGEQTNTAGNLDAGRQLLVQRLLSFLNIGLAVLMGASGVLGLMSHLAPADMFVSVYMVLFALLFFVYEIMWWKSIDSITLLLRKNFGFLFGMKGKSIFIMFIAFLNFGLNASAEPAKSLGVATGVCFLLNGILHLGLFMKYPELVNNCSPIVSSYNAPR